MVCIKILIYCMILIYGIHRNTKNRHDYNDFDIKAINKYTNRKYDKDGFDIKGIHEDTGTFFNKKMISEKIYQKILIG